MRPVSVSTALAAAALGCCLGLTACGGSGGSGEKGAARVSTADLKGVGTVLVDDKGQVLYMFAPDERRHVTCVDACAGTWPPLFTGAAPVAGHGLDPQLLGTDPDPATGKQVVTYNGWPLYTYVADVEPGDVTGQALDLNGGYWYVVPPSGVPLVPPGHPKLAS
jgi:predicted lipoprotein with Yx(FWY)xxD motif